MAYMDEAALKAQVNGLCALIDERRDELFSLLSALIRIDSQNFRHYGNERECAAYIHEICRDMGLESEMYSPMDIEDFARHPDFFPGRHIEDRFNVTARWRGAEDTDGLMLMGHHDTVEIGDVSKWDSDPLSGELRDGRIYGRGACDDKYALAAALFIIKLLRESGFVPKKNLLFTAYCDEEHGGSHGALAAVLRYPCERVVNMDGKQGQIWHSAAGGGGLIYRFRTRGTVATAGIAAAAIPIVLRELDRFGARRRSELEANPYYRDTLIPETSHRYMEIRVGDKGLDLGSGVVKFTYYTDRSREEISAELAEVEKRISAQIEPLGLVSEGFTLNTRFFHYVNCAPDDAAIKDMQAASIDATGKPLEVCGSCLSDLSVIAKYGPGAAFGYGAGREFGDEGGSHQPNEFIGTDELIEYTKTIAAYVLRTLG